MAGAEVEAEHLLGLVAFDGLALALPRADAGRPRQLARLDDAHVALPLRPRVREEEVEVAVGDLRHVDLAAVVLPAQPAEATLAPLLEALEALFV